MRTFKLVAAIAVALTCVGGSVARASATSDSFAELIVAITIQPERDLDFGSIMEGPGEGTVIQPPTTPRQFTGSLVPGDPGNSGPAIFTVAGDPGHGYTIMLPDPIILESGPNTMTVDTFASSPSGAGILSGGGEQAVHVGATLHVGANQPPGTYSQSFDVTVAYN